MRVALLLVVSAFAALSVSVVSAGGISKCRFAPTYTMDELATNPTRQRQFIMDVMYWEGQFQVHNVSYNKYSGHTFDGRPIGFNTGLPVDEPHLFSAPSKESLHLGMLALAVAGNPFALAWVAAKNTSIETGEFSASLAVGAAVDILTAKISTYEKFNRTYPGFGGWMPWVFVYDDRIEPAPDWRSPVYRVPSLDNGEIVWALFATYNALQDAGYTVLAARYRAYFQLMASTAVMMFHDGGGRIRGVTHIFDAFATPTPSNYELMQPCGDPCYLDDPYEGELTAFFMDLYGTWPNPSDKDAMWQYKEKKLQSVEFPTPSGPITVQRGWWFSSHEQWKFLLMPYFNIPLIRRVYNNGERARSWNSFLKGRAGMYASVNDVTHGDEPIPDYVGAVGVQEIAFQQVLRSDIVTPYGAFPTVLADLGVGLTWYQAMLKGPRMQGVLGSVEAVVLNGTAISPLVTWDSKITTALAMACAAPFSMYSNPPKQPDNQLNANANNNNNAGGISISSIVALGLSRESRYARFVSVATDMYTRVFTQLKGEQLEFHRPAAVIPLALSDFPLCS